MSLEYSSNDTIPEVRRKRFPITEAQKQRAREIDVFLERKKRLQALENIRKKHQEDIKQLDLKIPNINSNIENGSKALRERIASSVYIYEQQDERTKKELLPLINHRAALEHDVTLINAEIAELRSLLQNQTERLGFGQLT